MKYKRIILGIFTAVVMGGALFVQPAFAAPAPDPKDPNSGKITCVLLPDDICNAAKNGSGTDVKNSGIFKLLLWILNILTAGVGIAAVGALVYAGILYSSAGGTTDKVTKAKTIITDTVIGIVAYAAMFLALQWLIPGGVFG